MNLLCLFHVGASDLMLEWWKLLYILKNKHEMFSIEDNATADYKSIEVVDNKSDYILAITYST